MELTTLLEVSLSGVLLPLQLIYAGKTTSSLLPLNPFTMREHNFSPLHGQTQREKQPSRWVVHILQILLAHKCQEFLKELEEKHMKHVFVSSGQLQPLDVAVND